MSTDSQDSAPKKEESNPVTTEELQKMMNNQFEQVNKMMQEYKNMFKMSTQWQQRINEAVNDEETQIQKAPQQVTRDPAKFIEQIQQDREDHELVYGIGQKYNVTEPLGWLKYRIVTDLRQGIPVDKVIELYKDEIISI